MQFADGKFDGFEIIMGKEFHGNRNHEAAFF